MATNTNKEHRIGPVRDRSQFYNCPTSTWLKRDTDTGQFVAGRSAPYKGIRRE